MQKFDAVTSRLSIYLGLQLQLICVIRLWQEKMLLLLRQFEQRHYVKQNVGTTASAINK